MLASFRRGLFRINYGRRWAGRSVADESKFESDDKYVDWQLEFCCGVAVAVRTPPAASATAAKFSAPPPPPSPLPPTQRPLRTVSFQFARRPPGGAHWSPPMAHRAAQAQLDHFRSIASSSGRRDPLPDTASRLWISRIEAAQGPSSWALASRLRGRCQQFELQTSSFKLQASSAQMADQSYCCCCCCRRPCCHFKLSATSP